MPRLENQRFTSYTKTMGRCVGVRIIHPRMRYAPLLWLDRAAKERHRFTTVSDDQTIADVEIHVLENTAGSWSSRQTLHIFHLTNLHPLPEVGAAIDIATQYDGQKMLKVTILVDGTQRDTVSLEVHPEPRRHVLLPIVAGLLLVLAAGSGALFFSRSGHAPPPGSDSADTEISRPRSVRPDQRQDDAAPDKQDPSSIEPEAAGTETQEADTGSAAEAAADATAKPDEIDAPAPKAAAPEPAIENEQRTVYFTPDDTFLTDKAKAELRELASLLQKSPDAEVTLIGHTAVFGEEEEQWVISRQRAENAADYLRQQGWSPRIPPELDWQGPTQPVTRDPDRQQINRRVEIIID